MSTAAIALCSKVAIFEALCRVARDGGRCPDNDSLKRLLIAMNCPPGPWPSKIVSRLAHEGHITVLVYAKNYRVVTILTGPDMGATTERPGGKPHTVVRRTGFLLPDPEPLPSFADCPKVKPNAPRLGKPKVARPDGGISRKRDEPYHRVAYSTRRKRRKRKRALPVARSDFIAPISLARLMSGR